MKKSKITGKNIITGALLLGGILGGLAGINAMAHATETKSTRAQEGQTRDVEFDFQEIMVPVEDISSEEELINLVVEQGTQILIDETTGQLYMVYIEDDQVLVTEITEDYLVELLQQPMPISETETEEDEQLGEGGYVPPEYWRGESATTTSRPDPNKKQRKRLDSEEGRKAIDDAKKYKQENKK